jgi:hypothetical protein
VEHRTRTVEERLAELEQRCGRAERRLRVACGLGVAALAMALFASPATRATAQAGYGATLQSLINKTQFISVANGEMFISGTNLHVVNGMGSTDTTNALGNLIIGYNALRGGGLDVRTGSHNLVLGDANNYTFYGGMVAGSNNTISAPYASVSGGASNTASGNVASVSGGLGNMASGIYASVSGGAQNTANSFWASVSGGASNTASGQYASVSGGLNHNQGGAAIWQGGTLISGP